MTPRRGLIAGLAVAAVAWLGASPPTAAAAVRIDRERIVVEAPGAGVVIEREPFAMAFRDAAGRTVLRTVSEPPTAARALPPTRDPEPLGLEQEPDNAVYAPLTLEVGREERRQWSGSFWPGNMLLVAPVATQGATRRLVYFPRGCWADPRSGARLRGPRGATVAAPLGRLPYFFRCGRRPF